MSLTAQHTTSATLALFPVGMVWSTPLDRAVTTPPAFGGRRAFFPVEGGEIAAFDGVTGTADWTAPGAPLSMPATGGGLLFFAEADAIVALDQDSGVLRWRLPFAVELQVPLVWDNGWLVGADVDGTLLAFRATDGVLIWKRDLGSRVHAPPALAADRVYAALEDGRVAAFDVTSGAPIWNRKLGGPANDMLALDDRLYVGSDDNFFYCLLTSNGEVAWRWRTGADVFGVPVVDEHRVYFVSRDNVLRALDRRSGAQRWKQGLPGRPTRGPIRAGEVLLVSGLSPKVTAFAMRDGAPAGDIAAPGELAAAPYVIDVRGVPQVIIVARDASKGTRVMGFKRTIDPRMDTPLGPLPGAITITPPPKEPSDGADATDPEAAPDATPVPAPVR